MSLSKNSSWVLVGKDGRTHSLPYGMIFIGREECEIILQAASADKRHAVVYYSAEEKEFHIKDLNSLTGTYVNGVKIPEQTYVKLKHLDCIRFGYGPDVFYLEKNAVVLPSHNSLPTTNNVIKEIHSDVKLPKETHSPKSVAFQSSPLLNRTDLPPDTLPLNLNEKNICNWQKEDNLSDSPDFSHRSESSSCSAPANSSNTAGHDHDASSTHSSPAAMAFTVAFENELATPRKKLGIRDSIRKFAPNKPEPHNVQRTVKPEQLGSQVPDCKSTLKSQSISECSEDTNAKMKDAASFLIEKMLNTEASIISQSGEMTRDGPIHEVHDDRSEAGTYTVEAENNDGDVEEARKRIDEVFGVMQANSAALLPLTESSYNKQVPLMNGHSKFPPNKNSFPSKTRGGLQESDNSSLWPRSNRALSRGRRSIPIPVDNSGSGDRQQVETNSQQRLRRASEPPVTPEKSRRSKLATSPKSPNNPPKTLSSYKAPVARTNNLSATSGDRNASSGDDPSQHRSPDNRSDGSKSPHSTIQWRKVPWNLSGSDAELDQSKSENNSVLSDTSTEPSSQSSHSGKVKTDHGPQMRLNRAFALRRARLEADSAKQKGARDNKNLSNSQKSMKKSGKLSASTTTLREECSGSKQNFRLAPALTKTFAGKPVVRSSDSRTEAYRRKPEVKSGHRRIESDPGKGIPVWRTESRPATAGSVTMCNKTTPQKPIFVNDGSGLQSFHRSMSCSVMNDAEIPMPVLPSSYVRSLEHSMLSGSQVVPGPTTDDFHTRKHPNKELTALDSLVISAIHQLSTKLWSNSKSLLEKEREKCPKNSDCWLMIEEVLPSLPLSETPEDGDLTKDLSSILKNLKRVEQGLEVLSCVLDSDTIQEQNLIEKKTQLPQNFFIVDM